jgi:toxin secretion/phage lysis holin
MNQEQIERAAWALKFLAAAIAGWWGSLPTLVQALILLMAIDIITGLLAAYTTRTLSSEVSFRGMARKAITLLLVATATLLEPHTGGLPLGKVVAGFYLAHEGLSIVENAALAGLPVPEIISDALRRVNGGQTPAARSRADG